MIDNDVKRNYAPKGLNINYCLSGFTLQIESINKRQTPYNTACKLISDIGFNPIDSLLKKDLLNKDLLNIYVEPVNTRTKEESIALLKKSWEVVHSIYQNISTVIYVEPKFDFILPVDNGGSFWDPTNDAQSNKNEQDDRLRFDPEWHLKQMQVISAWNNYFDNDPSKAGQNIVIGHPDAEYVYHPELSSQLAALGITAGKTKPLSKSSDSKIKAEPPSIWHGTATACLMVSPKGPDSRTKNNQGTGYVSGVAPGATLLPLKLGSDTPPLPNDDFRLYSISLANAINDAAEIDEPKRPGKPRVDVLSISLGGYPNLLVRRAIINATQKGIIVIVSAGNGIQFVSWPAVYDSVVAVASSTIQSKRASHSARGSRVNIAAPGEGIHCAILLKNGSYDVQLRDGTSYAAPLVAGIAALWLSHRQKEIDEIYKDEHRAKIPLAFAKLLAETCTPWEEKNCGPGIINADALLKAELPNIDDPELIIPRVIQYDENLALDQGGVLTFNHLFEATLSNAELIRQISYRRLTDDDFRKSVGALSIMEWTLGQMLGCSGRSLRAFLSLFGRELSFHFGTNFELYNLLVDALHAEKIEELLPTVREKLCEVASDNLCDKLPKPPQKS